jgi:hypothetical protein
MIIDDFDIVGIALAELKTDPPRPVYGHGPLYFPVAFDLVKPNTLEWAQIVERLGDKRIAFEWSFRTTEYWVMENLPVVK